MAPKRPTRQRKAPALLKQETPKKQSNKSQAKEKKAAAKKQKELDARAKSVLASLAPFCVNLAAILVTLFMAGNPAAAGVALALSAIVRTGPGLPPALCVMILMAFVGPDKLIKPHDHVFWKVRAQTRARARVSLSATICFAAAADAQTPHHFTLHSTTPITTGPPPLRPLRLRPPLLVPGPHVPPRPSRPPPFS